MKYFSKYFIRRKKTMIQFKLSGNENESSPFEWFQLTLTPKFESQTIVTICLRAHTHNLTFQMEYGVN